MQTSIVTLLSNDCKVALSSFRITQSQRDNVSHFESLDEISGRVTRRASLLRMCVLMMQYAHVMGDSGAFLGLAYNITGSVRNAIYISTDHTITLKSACDAFQFVTRISYM